MHTSYQVLLGLLVVRACKPEANGEAAPGGDVGMPLTQRLHINTRMSPHFVLAPFPDNL